MKMEVMCSTGAEGWECRTETLKLEAMYITWARGKSQSPQMEDDAVGIPFRRISQMGNIMCASKLGSEWV